MREQNITRKVCKFCTRVKGGDNGAWAQVLAEESHDGCLLVQPWETMGGNFQGCSSLSRRLAVALFFPSSGSQQVIVRDEPHLHRVHADLKRLEKSPCICVCERERRE
jgi:hypothetical protein